MDWNDYFKLHENTPHTSFLEEAVTKYSKDKNYALDIGAGNLRDTKYLLKEGFKVVAIDPEPALVPMAEAISSPSLEIFNDIAGKYDFPLNYFDLINAQDILSHFPKERFEFITDKIISSLKIGGVLCASFFGKNHYWNKEGKEMTFIDSSHLQDVFKDFDFVYIKDIERDSSPAIGQITGTNIIKHWHSINVIAIKK